MELKKLFEKVLEENNDPMRIGGTYGSHENDDDFKYVDTDNDENEFIFFDPDYTGDEDYYGSMID